MWVTLFGTQFFGGCVCFEWQLLNQTSLARPNIDIQSIGPHSLMGCINALTSSQDILRRQPGVHRYPMAHASVSRVTRVFVLGGWDMATSLRQPQQPGFIVISWCLVPLMRVRFGTSTKRGAVFCGLWGSQACGSNVDHLVFFCAVCAQAVVAGRSPKAPRAAFEWEQRGERPFEIVRVHGPSLRFSFFFVLCVHRPLLLGDVRRLLVQPSSGSNAGSGLLRLSECMELPSAGSQIQTYRASTRRLGCFP
jgi:hypothetical protein